MPPAFAQSKSGSKFCFVVEVGGHRVREYPLNRDWAIAFGFEKFPVAKESEVAGEFAVVSFF